MISDLGDLRIIFGFFSIISSGMIISIAVRSRIRGLLQDSDLSRAFAWSVINGTADICEGILSAMAGSWLYSILNFLLTATIITVWWSGPGPRKKICRLVRSRLKAIRDQIIRKSGGVRNRNRNRKRKHNPRRNLKPGLRKPVRVPGLA